MSILNKVEPNGGSEVWIGLATVRPKGDESILGHGVVGAVVNVLAIADCEATFARQVKEAAEAMGLELVELEECEVLEKRREKFEVDEALIEKAGEVNSTRDLRFGSFHTYTHEG